jgi:hypothetical protein
MLEDGADENEVAFTVGNDGTAEVAHYDVKTGKRKVLIPLRADPAIRPGPDSVNFLRVEVRGNELIFFVNNKRLGSLTDALPQGKLTLGVTGSTGKKQPAVWDFDDLTLSRPRQGATD